MKYLVSGSPSKPSIILIHGFALSPTIWDTLTQHLSMHYQCVCIELPRSLDDVDCASSDIEKTICNSIKQIILKLNIDKAILLGHSMGGYISLGFAEKNPNMIKQLLLLNSTCFADDAIRRDKRKQIIQHLQKYGASSFCNQAIPSWIANEYKQQHPAIVLDLIEEASQLDKEVLIAYQRYMIERPERTSLIQSQEIPSLIIVGELDPMIASEDFETLQHTTISTIDDAAHMCMLEHPKTTAQVIHHFIQQNL